MSEKRDLAIVGLLLGLLGGALVLAASVGGFDRGLTNLTLADLINRGVFIIVGLAILFGSLLLYRRSYSAGGLLNILMAILVLVIGPSFVGGILALFSGVLGLMAHEARG